MASLPQVVSPGRRRTSIKAKFILLILALLAVVFAALTLVFVQNQTRALRRALREQATAFAALATKPIGDVFLLYKDSGRLRIEQQIQRFTDLSSDIVNVAVVDANGRVQFSQNEDWPVQVTAEQASSFDSVVVEDNGRLSAVIQPFQEDNGLRRYVVVYAVSNASIDAATRPVVLFGSLLGGVGLAASAILTYLFVSRLFLSPLQRLSKEASEISGGNLQKQIEVARNDEIADLADSVNKMAESLKADIIKLREVDELKNEFIALASHNLRTPITEIKSVLELTETTDLPPDQRQKFMTQMHSSVTELFRLSEDLISLASLQSGQLGLTLKPTDLVMVTHGAIKKLIATAAAKTIHIETNLQPVAAVMADEIKLGSVIAALIENAIKFSSASSTATVATGVSNGWGFVSVADRGTGIKPEELPKLFQKFHRGTSYMTYDYEGVGLSLALAKLIIDAHHGQIGVNSQPGQGSTFVLWLPLAKADKIPERGSVAQR